MSSFKEILSKQKSILIPNAHDAVSAKLIEQVGFEAMSIGGFAIVGTRFGYPDMGLASYREMRDAVIETTRSVSLPVLVDGDNGYGDFLNIERMIKEYEKEENISAIFMEDQVLPKRCGHLRGKEVISCEEMEKKIKTAVASRSRDDMWLMARTDARATDGLDEALRRGERYLSAGADALFVEAPESREELEKIGQTFNGIPLLANMLEGGKTPILSKKELEELGFSFIAYPVTLLLLAMKAMKNGLEVMKTEEISTSLQDQMSVMSDYHQLIGVTEALKREQELLNK